MIKVMQVIIKRSVYIILYVCLVIVGVSMFTSCTKRPPYQANISRIHVDPVNIDRYEEVLFGINPFALREEIEPHIETFYFFLGDEIDNPEALSALYDYITDPLIKELYLDTSEKWPDLDELEGSLTEAFRYYRAHYHDRPIPRIYSYVSGLNFHQPIKYANNHLVIGLDMYLGFDYPKYRRIGVPAYQVSRMDPAYVLPDVIRKIGEQHLQETTVIPETLLDYMIHEGKLLYFMDCMIPGVIDSLKIGYTADQAKWMLQNRGMVWAYYLANDMLYSSDRQMINKFIGDAPFTSAFSRNSAPKTAAWIGWQIVREYMRRNSDISLPQLIKEPDAAKILHESRYRGR
jgi:hypothetical protein